MAKTTPSFAASLLALVVLVVDRADGDVTPSPVEELIEPLLAVLVGVPLALVVRGRAAATVLVVGDTSRLFVGVFVFDLFVSVFVGDMGDIGPLTVLLRVGT